MSSQSKGPPPEEDAREWLLFDIEDQDPVTADFLKPPPSFAQSQQVSPFGARANNSHELNFLNTAMRRKIFLMRWIDL
jgi:hypothetical protein